MLSRLVPGAADCGLRIPFGGIAASMVALLTLPLVIAPMPPCTAIPRAGLHVAGDVRICPGLYRIPDPREGGVLIVTTSDTHLDLSGVTIESGDSVPAHFIGVGVLVRGADRVVISGGRIRGYRWGIRRKNALLAQERKQAVRGKATDR